MNILFDTSVIVSSFVNSHPKHDACIKWFKKVIKSNEDELLISVHSLAECYSTLSALPLNPRISPDKARQLISANLKNKAKIIPLTANDYFGTLDELAHKGLSGGIVYDALILKAAQKGKAEKLLTLNPKDFERIIPTSAELTVIAP